MKLGQVVITDQITCATVTVDRDAVAGAIAPWYEGAPRDVRSRVLDAIDALERALVNGDPAESLASYLAVTVTPVR